MSRKRRQNKNATVAQSDKNATKQKKEYDIQFLPIVIDPETGYFENIHLFEQLLPVFEEYSIQFADDSTPKVENYKEWLAFYIEFVKENSPWMFVVMVNGHAQGLIWAINWTGHGLKYHSVEIGGLCKRKTPPEVTTLTIRKMIKEVFEQTDVYIIRGEAEEANRASLWAMARAGMSHPEKVRAFKVRDGLEITGTIRSITRPEWMEAQNVQ